VPLDLLVRQLRDQFLRRPRSVSKSSHRQRCLALEMRTARLPIAPSGTVIIGGGVANIQETTPATTGFAYVTEDGPYLGDSNSVPTEWIGDVYNTHNTSITYDVYAICIVAQ